MTLLVFGQTGQVATELQALAPEAVFLGRDRADLSDPAACAAAIHAHAPSAVINAAAYTAVDKAEEEEPLATTINGAAPGAMAGACAALNIPFVQISTDYVFEGGGTAPWAPTDPTGPLGAYGRSKLAGEQAVAQAGTGAGTGAEKGAGGAWAILRTSWVFSAHGANFLKTMLRLAETRDALNVVDDQIGGPTPADAIARACLTIAEGLKADRGKTGIYHFSGAPDTSWAGFATEIFARAGKSVAVTGIPTSAYPTPATRPLNSRMACTSLQDAFGLQRPDWRAGIDRALSILGDS